MLPLENLIRLMFARDFAGGANNSYCSTPAAVVGNTNFSACCWMKYQSNNGGVGRGLIKLGTSNGFALAWQTADADLQFLSQGVGWFGPQMPMTIGPWHHIGFSRATGNLSMWRNGVVIANYAPLSTSGPSGVFSCGGHNSPDAQLGDFAAWNVELSTEEWVRLSLGISPKHVRPGSLQIYWPLWGDSVEIDLSGKGRSSATTMGGAPPKIGESMVGCPYHLAGVG